MTKVRSYWFAAMLGLALCLTLSVWTGRGNSSSRTQWEYKDVVIGERQTRDVERILNDLGAEGWELVIHTPVNDGPREAGYYYFKRTK